MATTSHDAPGSGTRPPANNHGTLHGHTNYVNGVAFSLEGTLLASTSDDQTARLWDPVSGLWLTTLLAFDKGSVRGAVPDGTYKLVGDPGRSLWWAIKLCRFAPGELDPYDPKIQQLPPNAPMPR